MNQKIDERVNGFWFNNRVCIPRMLLSLFWQSRMHLKCADQMSTISGGVPCTYMLMSIITADIHVIEPPRDKTNNVAMRPVWSESSLSAWRKLRPVATNWAHSEDTDQTGRLPRLIWVFAGRTATLLVLSRGGSIIFLRCENYQLWQTQLFVSVASERQDLGNSKPC